MAGKISKEIMEQVMLLAKLEVTDEEKEQAAADMQNMLDYVEKMKELDTSGTEPMIHPYTLECVWREDEVTNGNQKEELLQDAPAKENGQYLVPKTVE